jgi:F0F1-type ATP synthase membrane subunit b/b'
MGTTTKYLKAQLRDNEDAMNKAIRAERRKAKEEVARMKEAMVGMLNKERKTMRDELKRQTMELRNLLAEATGGDAMER